MSLSPSPEPHDRPRPADVKPAVAASQAAAPSSGCPGVLPTVSPAYAFQRILFLVNPRAGRKLAPAVADATAETLKREGFAPAVDATVRHADLQGRTLQHFRERIAAHDAVVFASGDGTLSSFLPLLAETGKPVYLLPMGNESLFAQTHRMNREASRLVQVLRSGTIVPEYYATFVGRPFHSMLEVDALASPTVERFARWRWGGSSNFWYGLFGAPSFLGMAARSLLGSQMNPCLSVIVDGAPMITEQSGSLLVAKTAAYAGAIRLAPTADPQKPTLVVGFHPGTTLNHQIDRALSIKKRVPATRWVDVMRFREGKEIRIQLHGRLFPFQADGERVDPALTVPGREVVASIAPRPFHVIQPSVSEP